MQSMENIHGFIELTRGTAGPSCWKGAGREAGVRGVTAGAQGPLN